MTVFESTRNCWKSGSGLPQVLANLSIDRLVSAVKLDANEIGLWNQLLVHVVDYLNDRFPDIQSKLDAGTINTWLCNAEAAVKFVKNNPSSNYYWDDKLQASAEKTSVWAAICLANLRDIVKPTDDSEQSQKKQLVWATLWRYFVDQNNKNLYWIPQPNKTQEISLDHFNWLSKPEYSGHEPGKSAFQLLAAVRLLQPRFYDVRFLLGDDADQWGAVATGRVYLFNKPNPNDELLSNLYELLPDHNKQDQRIVPWSILTVANTDIQQVFNNIKNQLSNDEKVLIEFIPNQNSYFRNYEITGESLGIAMLLAMQAARMSMNLYPIITTAKVAGDNIQSISELKSKLTALTAWQKQVKLPGLRLLLTKQNIENGQGHDIGLLKVQGSQCYLHDSNNQQVANLIIYEMPSKIHELLEQKTLLFTDGLDDYRGKLQKLSTENPREQYYLSSDIQLLNDLVQKMQQHKSSEQPILQEHIPVVDVPFNAPVTEAVKYIIQQLISTRSTDESQSSGNNPTLQTVPVPVLLPKPLSKAQSEALFNDGMSIAEIFRLAIQAGCMKLFGDKITISDVSLNHILYGQNWSKFIMLFFSESSLERDLEQEQLLFAKLKQQMIQPGIILPTLACVTADYFQTTYWESLFSESGKHIFYYQPPLVVPGASSA